MDNITVSNRDAMRSPGWLHDVFITEVLSKHYTNPRVNDFIIVPLSNKYSIFRACFDFNANEFDGNQISSFIVKQQTICQELRKNLNDFNTEINIYTDVIPKFEQSLCEKGDKTVFAPRCLFHQYYPRKVIVLEDLQARGYKVVQDRLLRIDEVVAALKKIGKWHAVSYKLAQENPSFFKEYRYGLLVAPYAFNTAIMFSGFENFMDLLKRIPKLQLFKPSFERLRLNYGDELKKPFAEYGEDRQPDVYYALNHGDLHARNMMFKRNQVTDQIEDVMFIDFQISYMGPMATDLMYTMYQLLTSEERLQYRDEWIHVHFTEFQEALKTLAFNGPTPKLTEFRDQIMRYKSFEYYLVYTFLPIWYAHDNGENTRRLLSTEEGRRKLYNNRDYIDELYSLLRLYKILGYFH